MPPWKLGQTSSGILLPHIGISSHQHTFWQLHDSLLQNKISHICRQYWLSACGMYLRMASNIGPLVTILAQTGQLIAASFCFFDNNHGT